VSKYNQSAEYSLWLVLRQVNRVYIQIAKESNKKFTGWIRYSKFKTIATEFYKRIGNSRINVDKIANRMLSSVADFAETNIIHTKDFIRPHNHKTVAAAIAAAMDQDYRTVTQNLYQYKNSGKQPLELQYKENGDTYAWYGDFDSKIEDSPRRDTDMNLSQRAYILAETSRKKFQVEYRKLKATSHLLKKSSASIPISELEAKCIALKYRYNINFTHDDWVQFLIKFDNKTVENNCGVDIPTHRKYEEIDTYANPKTAFAEAGNPVSIETFYKNVKLISIPSKYLFGASNRDTCALLYHSICVAYSCDGMNRGAHASILHIDRTTCQRYTKRIIDLGLGETIPRGFEFDVDDFTNANISQKRKAHLIKQGMGKLRTGNPNPDRQAEQVISTLNLKGRLTNRIRVQIGHTFVYKTKAPRRHIHELSQETAQVSTTEQYQLLCGDGESTTLYLWPDNKGPLVTKVDDVPDRALEKVKTHYTGLIQSMFKDNECVQYLEGQLNIEENENVSLNFGFKPELKRISFFDTHQTSVLAAPRNSSFQAGRKTHAFGVNTKL